MLIIIRVLFILLILSPLTLTVFCQSTGDVTAIKANLRGTPSSKGIIITTLNNGETFKVIEDRSPWYLIQTPKYVGWIHMNAIILTDYSGLDRLLEKSPSPSSVSIVGISKPTPPSDVTIESFEKHFGVQVPSNSPNPKYELKKNQVQHPQPAEIVRYATGTNLSVMQNTSGRGSLHITNGTNLDSIAKLINIQTNQTIRLIYIQSSSQATIRNIQSGNYILKFSLGMEFDRLTNRFTNAQSFSRFDEILNFFETRVGNQIKWRDFEVTLNSVVGGNASTSPITKDDFEGP